MKNKLLVLFLMSVVAGVLFYSGCADDGNGGGVGVSATPEAPSSPSAPPEDLPPTAEDTSKYWVSSSEGSDDNLGTISSPFATIGKAVSAAIATGGVESVFVVGGTYRETVSIGNATGYYGIAVRGGYGAYDPASRSRARDLAVNLTEVDGFVVDGSAGAPLNNSEATVEGFIVSSLSILNASPSISSNRIASASPACVRRAALLLQSSDAGVSAPVIAGNVIDNVNCLGASSEVIGVELLSAGTSQLKPQLRQNQISGGSGISAATRAMGIMGRSADTSVVELTLEGNTVAVGSTTEYVSGVTLFADSASSGASSVALSNDIRAGTSAQGYGVDLGYDPLADVAMSFTSADLQQNKIYGGTNCIFSAGISISSATAASSIINNFISAGKSTQLLAFEEGIRLDLADASIVNNTIVADTGDTAYLIDLVSQTSLTSIDNNITFISTANPGGVLAGILEAVDTSPASVKNNLFDTSVEIVFSSSFGGFGDLLNVADLEVSYPVYTANLQGLANLVDVANLDLHISAGSAAIDVADQAKAPAVDFDGAARPSGAGSDIGADEL